MGVGSAGKYDSVSELDKVDDDLETREERRALEPWRTADWLQLSADAAHTTALIAAGDAAARRHADQRRASALHLARLGRVVSAEMHAGNWDAPHFEA